MVLEKNEVGGLGDDSEETAGGVDFVEARENGSDAIGGSLAFDSS